MPVRFVIPDQTQPGPQFARLRRDPSPWPSPPSPRQESRCSRVLGKVKKSKVLTKIRCSKVLAVINRFKTRLFDKISSPLSSRSGSLEQGDSHTAARVAQRYMEDETEDVGLGPFGEVAQHEDRVAMTSEIGRGRMGFGIVSIGDSGSRMTGRVASGWVNDDYEPPGEFGEVEEEDGEDVEEVSSRTRHRARSGCMVYEEDFDDDEDCHPEDRGRRLVTMGIFRRTGTGTRNV